MYTIRKLQNKDISKISSWKNNKELLLNIGTPEKFINQQINEEWFENFFLTSLNVFYFVIVSENDEEIIGLIILSNINYMNKSSVLQTIIEKNIYNKDNIILILKSFCEYIFNKFGVHRIETSILSNNKKLKKLYVECGFIKEGTKKDSIYENGVYANIDSYALLNKKQNLINYNNKLPFFLALVQSSIQKKYAISVCDTAFESSIIGRKDYNSLFKKIDLFADFCIAYSYDVIGYTAMYANDLENKIAYITLIAVRQDFQKNGVGKSLLNWCENTAYKKGMKILRLEVNKKNKKARTFYEKNGFEYESIKKTKSLYMRKIIKGDI